MRNPHINFFHIVENFGKINIKRVNKSSGNTGKQKISPIKIIEKLILKYTYTTITLVPQVNTITNFHTSVERCFNYKFHVRDAIDKL